MYRVLLTILTLAVFGFNVNAATIQVSDTDIQPGSVVKWTSDNVYVLNGFVFVESGSELHIEAGTVIKAKPGEASNASALIIARGGKIFAEGTPTQPIIFTAESDDLSNPNDLTKDDRGLWGGVIVLGSARINVAGGIENIEGIPVEEERGQYGGNDDNDNSGVIRFVSIRHAGSNIGQDNEINGLTMGAVGSGTTIEYIEVFANQDDGYEWFGGTVNTKYIIAAFCGDDGFDYDEGFRGKGQFWFSIQDDKIGGSAGEHDGGTSPEDGQPYAIPVIYNATYIGSGMNSTNTKNTPFINMRDNAGGKYYSSIFMEGTGYGLQIEDLPSGEDSKARLEAGDLEYTNNLWYNFKSGIADASKYQFILDYLTNPSNNNRVSDPMLNSISRTNDGKLDPRPSENSPAFTGYKMAPNDGFYSQVNYCGAFGENNWAVDWSFLGDGNYISRSGAGYIISIPTSVIEVEDNNNSISDISLYPNPVGHIAYLNIAISEISNVNIEVYDILGNKMMTVLNQTMTVGSYKVDFDASELSTGAYYLRMNTNQGTATAKFVKN